LFRRKKPAPRSAMPGMGNQRAAPPVRFAEPVLTVVMVSIEVTVPLADRAPDVGLSEQVGGFAEELTTQPRFTVPEAPVDVTVTVDVPVLPRLIELGVMVPALMENFGALCEYFTTNASRQVPVQRVPPELVIVVWKEPGITGKFETDCVSPVT